MRGSPPLSRELVAPEALPHGTAGLAAGLARGRALRHTLATPLPTEICVCGSAIWMVVTVNQALSLVFRLVQDGVGLFQVDVTSSEARTARLTAIGGNGRYECVITLLEDEISTWRYTTTLTPSCALRMAELTPDVCVLDGAHRPFRSAGRLFTVQSGLTAGQLFFQVPGRRGGGLLYFQNLSSLRDYAEQTGSSLGGAVQVKWPVAGFVLPAGEEPLAAGRKVVISDAFISPQEHPTTNEAEAAQLYLDFIAGLYPCLPAPATPYQDWPGLAQKSLAALRTETGCCRRIRNRLYAQAYVASSEKPPESMVQGALAVPLAEYEAWRGRPVPLLRKLRHYPTSFYHSRLRVPVRWLLGAKFAKKERSEEEHHYLMDSWYLMHTMLNIGRLAEMGDTEARTVFLNSVETLIAGARHFDYDWPVFYDQRDFSVAKEETAEGEGGEQDAAGLYVHVMLQAHLFTHDQRFVDEARRSATKLTGLGFGVLYQTNTTALTAVAMARLWKLTEESAFRDLSLVCVASILSHLWLWETEQPAMTYMALPPLHDPPYVAFYEEAEVLGCLHAWLKEMGGHVPPSASLLIAEYQKHLLARAHYYYPAFLPPDRVTPEPKEGVLKPRLFIPLEGLGAPGEAAGTVGQSVYAAGAPFILCTRCWHRPRGVPFTLFCEYPVLDLEREGSRSRGKLRCFLAGSSECRASLRLLTSRGSKERFSLTVNGAATPWHSTSPHRGVEVPGGSEILIEWGPKNSSL